MTYNEKQLLKEKLPSKWASKIANKVGKTSQHVRNCFDIGNYNDDEVFNLARQMAKIEIRARRELKKIIG